jgi:hypothetical protein
MGMAWVPLPTSLLIFVVGSGALVWFAIRRRRRTAWLTAIGALAVLSVGIGAALIGSLDAVLLRSAGDDWLAYESFARSILESWSLEGGESVFYFVPFYRYARFTQRLVFGDGDLLAVATSLAMTTILVAALAYAVARNGRPSAWRSPAIAIVAALLIAVVVFAGLRAIVQGLAEPAAWIALVAAGVCLARPGPRPRAAAMAGLALAAITRPNLLPGVLAIAAVAIGLSRQGWRDRAMQAGILSAILALPLAHNLAYGGEWVLANTSYRVPTTVAIGTETLPDQLRRVLYLAGDGRGLRQQIAFTGLQVVWLTALALWVRRRPRDWRVLLLLLTPLIFIATQVVLSVMVYYPRHIIAPHLMMGVVALLALRHQTGANATEGHARVESALPPGQPMALTAAPDR